MRRLRTLVCLPLLALPLSAGTVHASVVPDVGHVQCTAAGAMTTRAGLTAESVQFSASLFLSCTGVGADDAGQWFLSMSGQISPGACAGAAGLASMGGSGPDGGVSAGVALSFTSTSMTISGSLTTSDSGGDAFHATLSVTPTSGTPCVDVDTQSNLTGEATITDQPPPPDEVFCTATGNENYDPAEMLAPASVIITGTAALTCTEPPTSDDRGAWAVDYSGAAEADCGLAEGTMGMSYSGPDASGSGTVGYERVGTLLSIVGTDDDNEFAIFASVNFSGTCTSTPFFGAHYSTGAATVIE